MPAPSSTTSETVFRRLPKALAAAPAGAQHKHAAMLQPPGMPFGDLLAAVDKITQGQEPTTAEAYSRTKGGPPRKICVGPPGWTSAAQLGCRGGVGTRDRAIAGSSRDSQRMETM